jgi:hypothetical protein
VYTRISRIEKWTSAFIVTIGFYLDYLLAAELIEIGDREIGFDIECGDKME